MSDYQAIYDAVRSRISGGDVGAAVRDVLSSAFDISFQKQRIEQELNFAIAEWRRPSVLFKPELIVRERPDAKPVYFAKFHDVSGTGATPDASMRDFDERWSKP